ncbi:MAG: hypothetical protein R3236_08395, partial [Phycisphaeraceae bacterium]|nr:hypothetical protein [Phycisphaeraceae bacterium]
MNDGRVLQVRSDHGRLVAPNNIPRSGQFSGHVVINIFQTPVRRPLDLSTGSPDRVFEIKIEPTGAIAFDAGVSEISTDNRLEITTPRTDQIRFRGRGMRLTYNEPKSRIERLVIDKGHSLRYRPATAPGAKKPPAARTADKPTPPKASESKPKPQAPAKTGPKPPPAQFYQLVFEDRIRVVQQQRTIVAHKLETYFALGHLKAPLNPAVKKKTATSAIFLGALQSTAVPAGPFVAAKTTETEAPPSPDGRDVVMTWSGRMVMTPLKRRPVRLTRDDDLFMRFIGTEDLPVEVTVGAPDKKDKAQRIRCGSLEYSESARTVTALHNVRVHGADSGTIEAASMNLFLDRGRGLINGAGRLYRRQPEAPASKNQAADPANELSITWEDHVDLNFEKSKGQKGLGPLKQAIFQGNIRIDQPRMTLTADRLFANFGQVLSSSDGPARRQLKTVDAVADPPRRVSVVFKDQPGGITATKLHVINRLGADGRAVPAEMIATGAVQVRDKNKLLKTEHLQTWLAQRIKEVPVRIDPKAPKPDPKKSKPVKVEKKKVLVLEKVLAKNGIYLLDKANGSEVSGDKLHAQLGEGPDGSRIESALIIGTDRAPAVLSRREKDKTGRETLSRLRVAKHLNLESGGTRIWSRGPGRMLYTETRPARKTEKGAVRPADDRRPERVEITWSESMNYDNLAGTVTLTGKVKASSRKDRWTETTLESRKMILEMTSSETEATGKPKSEQKKKEQKAPIEPGASPDEAETEKKKADPATREPGRRLHRVTATGSARLTARRLTAPDPKKKLPGGKLKSLMQLEGEELVFNQQQQMAYIHG